MSIDTDNGGSIHINPPSDIVRNRQQVYNAFRSMKGRHKTRDTGQTREVDFSKLVCLMSQYKFLKDVSFTKKKDIYPKTFAVHDPALVWMKKYCTPSSIFPRSQVGIDMTYKVGQFYVTIFSFPHPMFTLKDEENRNPTILLGMMSTTTRDVADYEYLASKLHSLGIHSLIYGTDSEYALERAMENVFPVEGVSQSKQSIHLRCFNHVVDDLKAELRKLQVPKKRATEIITEILGREYDGIRKKGLVDCSEADFEAKWNELSSTWPHEFVEYMSSTKLRVRPLKDTLMVCMARSVRVAAGLGDPPNKFHNQRAESINNVLKEEMGHVKVDQVALHELVEANMVDQQYEELSKALYGMGEYRLAHDFKYLQKHPVQWRTMKPEQREKFISSVLGKGVIRPRNETRDAQLTKLSVQPGECAALADLPLGMVQEMWQKAETIISCYDIRELPSGDLSVTDYDSATVVRLSTSGMECQCKEFTVGICAHVLVVAELTGQLQDTLAKFHVAPSNIINRKRPKSAGEKGGKKPRKRRNNVASKPIEVEIDPGMMRVGNDDISRPRPVAFTEVYHNDEPFEIVFIPKMKRKKPAMCQSCRVQFQKNPLPPVDIAVKHKERYIYPHRNKDSSIDYRPTVNKLATRYYCMKKQCLLNRHPYFWVGLLKIADETNLQQCHYSYIKTQVGYVSERS